MKIYTKTGDTGETGLFAGPRVRKDHHRIEAYGAVDELNAVLGLVRAEWAPIAANPPGAVAREDDLPASESAQPGAAVGAKPGVESRSYWAALDALLARVQNDLFDVGAELATPDAPAKGTAIIGSGDIAQLEAAIDQYQAELPPLAQFVLPGGCKAAALLHVARTVCRRAERRLVTLMHAPRERVSADVLMYLNRLSDLLFVLARAANRAAGVADVPWVKRQASARDI